MGDKYLSSATGTPSAPNETWADAYNTLQAAVTGLTAGETIFVGDDHTETAISTTQTYDNNSDTLCRVIATNDHITEPPTVILASGRIPIEATSGVSLNFRGHWEFQGLAFKQSAFNSSADFNFGTSTSNQHALVFRDCLFWLNNTASSMNMQVGGISTSGITTRVVFEDTDFRFGASGQYIHLWNGLMEWKGGAIDVTTATPAALMLPRSSGSGLCTVEGVDLSPISTAVAYVDISNAASWDIKFIGCKLHATPSFTTGTPVRGGVTVEFIACDDGTGEFQHFYQDSRGSFEAVSSVSRTGGASNGVSSYSYEIITTSLCNEAFPLAGPWMDIFVESGTKTITCHFIAETTALQDDEIWLEAEYLDDVSSEYLTITSDKRATILTTPANQATSTETWTEPMATPVKQQLVVSGLTVGTTGAMRARVVVGKPSIAVTDLYFCPKLEIS